LAMTSPRAGGQVYDPTDPVAKMFFNTLASI